MKLQNLKIFAFSVILITQLTQNLHAQNDTTIKYLSSYRWLWPQGASLINERTEMERAHAEDTLFMMPPVADIMKKDTINLYGISFSNYDNMQLSFNYNEGQVSKYEDSISKFPSFIVNNADTLIASSDSIMTFRNGDVDSVKRLVFINTIQNDKYTLQLNSSLSQTVSYDANGKEQFNALYYTITEIEFTYNIKAQTFYLTYDYCLDNACRKVQKKHFKYKLSILDSNKITLIPI